MHRGEESGCVVAKEARLRSKFRAFPAFVARSFPDESGLAQDDTARGYWDRVLQDVAAQVFVLDDLGELTPDGVGVDLHRGAGPPVRPGSRARECPSPSRRPFPLPLDMFKGVSPLSEKAYE